MCLQAHYRSELEFSWEGLGAALTRLKRMVGRIEKTCVRVEKVEPIHRLFDSGLVDATSAKIIQSIVELVSDDLNTPAALTFLEILIESTSKKPELQMMYIEHVDKILDRQSVV